MTKPPIRITVGKLERFWAHVVYEPNSGCWLWTGTTDADGYGHYGHNGHLAHRVSWQILIYRIMRRLTWRHL
jgi:hypothetical protein